MVATGSPPVSSPLTASCVKHGKAATHVMCQECYETLGFSDQEASRLRGHEQMLKLIVDRVEKKATDLFRELKDEEAVKVRAIAIDLKLFFTKDTKFQGQ